MNQRRLFQDEYFCTNFKFECRLKIEAVLHRADQYLKAFSRAEELKLSNLEQPESGKVLKHYIYLLGSTTATRSRHAVFG